jgi:hypothetical protein
MAQTQVDLRPPRALLLAPAGFVLGALLGVVARLWMRWISTEPQFSWDGTIFIVGAFAVFGLTQAVALSTRLHRRPRWVGVLARTLGTIGMLPLFTGAGSIMMPTVVLGGFAVWRRALPLAVRGVMGAVALLPVAFVVLGIRDDFGITVWSVGRIGLFVVIYAALIVATGATFAPITRPPSPR